MSDTIQTSEARTNNEPAPLHIAFYAHNWCGDFPCFVCGRRYRQDMTAAAFFETTDHSISNGKGEVCEDCLAAGAKGAADRARQYAANLRQHADELENAAQEIEGVKDWPTPAELEVFTRNAPRRGKGDPR